MIGWASQLSLFLDTKDSLLLYMYVYIIIYGAAYDVPAAARGASESSVRTVLKINVADRNSWIGGRAS